MKVPILHIHISLYYHFVSIYETFGVVMDVVHSSGDTLIFTGGQADHESLGQSSNEHF